MIHKKSTKIEQQNKIHKNNNNTIIQNKTIHKTNKQIK